MLRGEEIGMRDELKNRGIRNENVLSAMENVPRHLFVPPQLAKFAYQDRPLPIGYDQTISQPYMVAFMTELLEPKQGDKILEVGTGSGYQAAVLAQIVAHVYSIEIIPDLALIAHQHLS